MSGFYIISFWYRREEAQQRFTVYWCSTLIATAFGGLLASAIADMDGVRGYSSWRWIFILEGIATILVGLAAFFLVTDFPSEAKWLTTDQRHYLVEQSKAESDKVRNVTLSDIMHCFISPRKILGGLLYFSKHACEAHLQI